MVVSTSAPAGFAQVCDGCISRDTTFGDLAVEAAASPKGAKGLICLPYFSGERTPIHDPQAKGAFFGLDLTHGRGEMYRALIEGIAQAAGLLVIDAIDYARQVVLAKVAKAEFRFDAVPGDVLRYEVEIEELGESVSIVRATSSIGGRPHGEAELVFGHLVEGEMVPKLMSKAELMEWLDSLRVFEVGTEPDGSPIIYDRLPHVT